MYDDQFQMPARQNRPKHDPRNAPYPWYQRLFDYLDNWSSQLLTNSRGFHQPQSKRGEDGKHD